MSAPAPAPTADPALLAALADDALRQASSPAIFERALGYVDGETVQGFVQEADGALPSARATIAGTQPYAVSVGVRGGRLTGRCGCPHAQEGWFCKHQVALALFWRARLDGSAVPAAQPQRNAPADAATRRARSGEDDRATLATFLRSQERDVLAQRLLDLAERDRDVERSLHTWRRTSQAARGGAGLKDLRALATRILAPGRDFLDWRASGAYAQRAADVLPLLEQASAHDPQDGIALAEHALRRVWKALEQADDSNGEIGELALAIGACWVQALQRAGERPPAFATGYLQLLLDDPFGCFDRSAAGAAMGERASARYAQLLAERWRAAKDADKAARAARARSRAAAGRPYRANARDSDVRFDADAIRLLTLQRLHVERLEADGDVDGVLAVLREDLPQRGAFVMITRLLEKHGRLREAFANAEAAVAAIPGDSGLEDDLLRAYERDGRVAEAFALRRQRFERRPDVEGYRALLAAATAAGHDATTVRAEVLAWLVRHETELAARRGGARDAGLPRWPANVTDDGPDVTVRVEILCSERRWEDALAAVSQPGACCDAPVRRMLARHLGPQRNAQRVALLQGVLEEAMRRATSPYRDELQAVREIADLLDADDRARWLARLRADFRTKRNFLAGLPGDGAAAPRS